MTQQERLVDFFEVIGVARLNVERVVPFPRDRAFASREKRDRARVARPQLEYTLALEQRTNAAGFGDDSIVRDHGFEVLRCGFAGAAIAAARVAREPLQRGKHVR